MDAAQQLLEGFLLGGLLILNPVHIGQAPEEGLVAHLVGHFQIALAVFTLGRPVVFLHGLACGLLVQCFQVVQLLGEGVLGGDFGHVRVVVGVVGDGVALGHHALHQVRAGGNVVADHKKCGGRVVLL